MRLCLFIEHGLEPRLANDAMLAITQTKKQFVWLTLPTSMGSITIADVQNVESAEEHQGVVRAWAASVWLAWSEHHEVIRNWLPADWLVRAK
jgi:hypothetical protein